MECEIKVIRFKFQVLEDLLNTETGKNIQDTNRGSYTRWNKKSYRKVGKTNGEELFGY